MSWPRRDHLESASGCLAWVVSCVWERGVRSGQCTEHPSRRCGVFLHEGCGLTRRAKSSSSPLSLNEELAQRTEEHGTGYCICITEAEAEELAAGRLPENVQTMCQFALEPLEVMLARKQRERARR